MIPHRNLTSIDTLDKIVSGRAVHLVSRKNEKFDQYETGDIVIRFNEDTEPCEVLMTALYEVPCLDHAKLIVHTMPPGKYALTDGSEYSNIEGVYSKETSVIPFCEVPKELWLEIAKSLPKWPTTGIVALELIRKTGCRVINLHGFSVWSEVASQIDLCDQLYINFMHYPPAIISYLWMCTISDSRIRLHGPKLGEVERVWRSRLGLNYDLSVTSLTTIKTVKYSRSYYSVIIKIRQFIGNFKL